MEYVKLSKKNGIILFLMVDALLFESNFTSCPQRLSREISVYIQDCLRKNLNVAGLLPEAKLFEIFRHYKNVLKIVETFFYDLRKLETFLFKCRLPEWSPWDSFHSGVIVLVGNQETRKIRSAATAKPIFWKEFPECVDLRCCGKFWPYCSEIQTVLCFKSKKLKTFRKSTDLSPQV